MTDERTTIQVKIFGKEYTFACPPEQTDALYAAAKQLDDRMTEVAKTSRLSSPERIAVMTALNICHEMMTLEKSYRNLEQQVEQSTTRMLKQLVECLGQQTEMPLPDSTNSEK